MTTAELRRRLELVAPVAQDLDVRVQVLTTEGQRVHVVHVHPVRGEVAQAPVAPGRAPFLHSPAEPGSSVPAVRPSPSPCPPGADVRAALVRGVMGVATAPMGRGLGAVDAAHVCPPGGVRRPGRRPSACSRWNRPKITTAKDVIIRSRFRLVCVPAPGLEPGNSAADIPSRGRYRAPLDVGSAGRWFLAGAGPVGNRVGTARAYNPFRHPRQEAVTDGRCGPRALPHDPCGHPSNGGAWCTGNASESWALSPPIAPVLGGCAVIPVSEFVESEGFPLAAQADSLSGLSLGTSGERTFPEWGDECCCAKAVPGLAFT